MDFELIFDKSYERVLNTQVDGHDFFQAFYINFLSNEDVARRFANTEMKRQQEMLKKSFYSLFTFYASGRTDDYISRIAERHSRRDLDIKPELYDRWLECLMGTVAQFDAEYSNDVELAWRLVLTPGIVYMKFQYDKFPVSE